jgi:hypothetical protein
MASKKDSVIKAITAFGDKKFHVNDVAMAADVSTPYASNILKAMQHEGALLSSKNGKKLMYKATGEFEDMKPTEKTFIPVEDRFRYIQNLTDMVIKGVSPSILITGMAGIGKTHLVTSRLEEAGKVEGLDYLLIKGNATPMGLFTVLHNNREATLVFDDTDAVFQDPVSINILKAALDSYDKRMVSWFSAKLPEQYDNVFEFRGSIIFISNLDESKIDKAVKSRTFVSNLKLSHEEVVDHMRALAPKIAPDVDMKLKTEVLDFLLEKTKSFEEFNLRTFIKAIKIRQGAPAKDWKNMVEHMA